MAINLASKFSSKVDERIKIGAYTGKNLNTDYDFTGVDTIKIYQIDTVALNAYTRSGSSRYGTPNDLGDSTQTLVLKQDMAYTFVIDQGDNTQQMMIKNASKAVKRETDEIVVPFTDRYRFAIACEEVKSAMTDSTALTKSNVYEKFLAGKEKLAEKGIENVVAYVTPAVFNLLKLDSSFVRNSDIGQKLLLKGEMGECDGTKIIMVAGNRLPKGVDFILMDTKAMISPTQLNVCKIHKDPVGVNGNVVEARWIFDAFILKSRAEAIFVQGARATAIAFTNATGYKTVASGIDVYCDEKVYYKVASAAITASTIGSAFVTTGYTEATSVAGKALAVEVTGTSTNKYAEVVVVDRNGNVRDAKAVTLEA